MLGYTLEGLSGELYRMAVVDKGLILTISRAFYDYLLGMLSEQKDREKYFLGIRAVLSFDVVKFELGLPFIPFPNRPRREIDWDTLWERSEQASFLLNLFNYGVMDDHSCFLLSANPQLMAVSTGTIRDRERLVACPIELGFHQSAFDVLKEECQDDLVVREAEELILKFYTSMSCLTKREKERQERNFRKYGTSFTGICAMIRAGGTPHFIVPGNCACLGEDPDRFKDSLSMYSHNMDSPLQQLSMLVGLASFWNDFLMPMWQARQSDKV